MNISPRAELLNHDALRAIARLFVSSASLTWRRWVWIVLLWLFAIPLSALGFFSMLLWAYGVDG